MVKQSDSIAKRIDLLIKELHMTNNSFAKSIGKSSTTINYIVDGKNKPGFDVLESILDTYPQVRPDFLMKGEGSIFNTNSTVSEPVSFGSDILSRVVEEFRALKDQLSVKDAQLSNKDKQIDGLQRTSESLQRTIDILLNGRQASDKSFRKPVSSTGRVFEMYPRQEGKRA